MITKGAEESWETAEFSYKKQCTPLFIDQKSKNIAIFGVIDQNIFVATSEGKGILELYKSKAFLPDNFQLKRIYSINDKNYQIFYEANGNQIYHVTLSIGESQNRHLNSNRPEIENNSPSLAANLIAENKRPTANSDQPAIHEKESILAHTNNASDLTLQSNLGTGDIFPSDDCNMEKKRSSELEPVTNPLDSQPASTLIICPLCIGNYNCHPHMLVCQKGIGRRNKFYCKNYYYLLTREKDDWTSSSKKNINKLRGSNPQLRKELKLKWLWLFRKKRGSRRFRNKPCTRQRFRHQNR